MYKNCFCIGPPWPSQMKGMIRRISFDAAVQENIAVRLMLRGRGSSYIMPSFFAENIATIKNGGGRAKDKICGAFNVAVFIVLLSGAISV